MRLGDKLEYIINIITFGKGKAIATWIANKLGYDDCGCDERRDALNKLFPYKKPKWFTEEEYNYLTEWFSKRRNTVTAEEQKKMFEIHNRILDENEKIAGGCTPCKFNRLQSKVKQVYDKYQ